jgi:hypothetical protein
MTWPLVFKMESFKKVGNTTGEVRRKWKKK